MLINLHNSYWTTCLVDLLGGTNANLKHFHIPTFSYQNWRSVVRPSLGTLAIRRTSACAAKSAPLRPGFFGRFFSGAPWRIHVPGDSAIVTFFGMVKLVTLFKGVTVSDLQRLGDEKITAWITSNMVDLPSKCTLRNNHFLCWIFIPLLGGSGPRRCFRDQLFFRRISEPSIVSFSNKIHITSKIPIWYSAKNNKSFPC